jgi:hypothetical protein
VSLDWDALVLTPVMGIFGEGGPADDALPFYTPRALPGFRLRDAVFDAQYELVQVATDGSQITAHMPVLGVRVALFPRDPAQNDQVLIPSTGKTYIVKDVQLDGHGHAKLVLQETGR